MLKELLAALIVIVLGILAALGIILALSQNCS